MQTSSVFHLILQAEPVLAKPTRPRDRIHVHAVRPDRDHLEIRFPRVEAYRVEQLPKKIRAVFNDDHRLRLTPDLVGATQTHNAGIVGEGVDLNLQHLSRL